jgi:hypothetical protein
MDDFSVGVFQNHKGEMEITLEFDANVETEEYTSVPVFEFLSLDQAQRLRDRLTAALEEAKPGRSRSLPGSG